MKMLGEQKIAAPRQRVWEALNDPAILQASIPGCQSLEREGEDRLAAVAEIRIGPIGARFKGAVTLSDLDPPNGYTITGQGSGGIAGSAKGGARVRLSDDGNGTLVSYEVDAEVGGRMAQLGGPIIDATAKQLATKFFARFGEIVEGEAAPAPADSTVAPAGAPTAPASTPLAAPAAKSGSPVMAWILAVVVAALVGFLLGRAQGQGGSDWAGLSTGLLLILVAAAAFEHGRRAASRTVVLDDATFDRLLSRIGR